MPTFDDLFNEQLLKNEIMTFTGIFDDTLWSLDANMGSRFNDHISAGKDPADFYTNEIGFIYQSAWNCAKNDEITKYSHMISLALEEDRHDALDYGCAIGTGVIGLGISGIHADGADICKPSLQFLRNRVARYQLSNVGVIDLRKDPIGMNYDFVICTEVLEHVSDPIGLMKELIDITTDDALFVLSWSFVDMTTHLPQHFHMQAKHPDTLLTEGFGKILVDDLKLTFVRNLWFNNYVFKKGF